MLSGQTALLCPTPGSQRGEHNMKEAGRRRLVWEDTQTNHQRCLWVPTALLPFPPKECGGDGKGRGSEEGRTCPHAGSADSARLAPQALPPSVSAFPQRPRPGPGTLTLGHLPSSSPWPPQRSPAPA